MQRIFLDLDGVMADFDKHFTDLFGLEPPSKGGTDDDTMWKLVYEHGNFFRTMPLMEGAKRFYMAAALAGIEFIILTAASKKHYQHVAEQKMEWVRKHFGPIILTLPVYGSSSKALFIQNKDDILIDDYKKNCDRWTAAGGIAIHHQGDFNQTYYDLLEKRKPLF